MRADLELKKEYTYKELCVIFDEKEKTSDSKIAQLKEWETLIKWVHPKNKRTGKQSKKFRITQIYDTPKYKVDLRKQKKYELEEDFYSLFFYFLSQVCAESHCEIVVTSKRRVYRDMFCFNPSFDLINTDDVEFGKNNRKFVSSIANTIFKEKVYNRMIKLEKDKKISLSECVRFNGRNYYKTSKVYNTYLRCENLALKALGYDNLGIAMFANSKKFLFILNNILKKFKLEGATRKITIKELDTLFNSSWELDDENYINTAVKWNNLICDSINKRIETTLERFYTKTKDIINENVEFFKTLYTKDDALECGFTDYDAFITSIALSEVNKYIPTLKDKEELFKITDSFIRCSKNTVIDILQEKADKYVEDKDEIAKDYSIYREED